MQLGLTRDALVLATLVCVALPQAARGQAHAQRLAVGGDRSCAVTTDGGMKCWGQNGYGQLGDGTATNRQTPVDVTGLTSGVAAAAAGVFHTCALTSGGAMKCWGHNGYGQIGDGTHGTTRLMPVDVVGLASGVIVPSAGQWHSCALTSDGAVKCWGADYSGQLGIEFIRTVVGLDLDADAALAEIPTLSVWALVLLSVLVAGSAYLARRTAPPPHRPAAMTRLGPRTRAAARASSQKCVPIQRLDADAAVAASRPSTARTASRSAFGFAASARTRP